MPPTQRVPAAQHGCGKQYCPTRAGAQLLLRFVLSALWVNSWYAGKLSADKWVYRPACRPSAGFGGGCTRLSGNDDVRGSGWSGAGLHAVRMRRPDVSAPRRYVFLSCVCRHDGWHEL